LHGFNVEPRLQHGDAIVRVNGLEGAKVMVDELRKKPPTLALVVLRVGGGGDAKAQEVEEEEDLFDIDSRLDGESVRLSEEVPWHALLEEHEGTLALAVVERSVDRLGAFLRHAQAVNRATRGLKAAAKDEVIKAGAKATAGDAGIAGKGRIDVIREATQRVIALRRQASTAEAVHKAHAESDSTEEDFYNAMQALLSAMVDCNYDSEPLRVAMRNFTRSAPLVKSSTAAQRMLKRARTLQALWSWRRRCTRVGVKLREAIQVALEEETDRNHRRSRRVAQIKAEVEAKIEALKAEVATKMALAQGGSDFTMDTGPDVADGGTASAPPAGGEGATTQEEVEWMEEPQETDLLRKVMQEAAPFAINLEFELAEASAILERHRVIIALARRGNRPPDPEPAPSLQELAAAQERFSPWQVKRQRAGPPASRAQTLGERLGWWP